MINLRAASEGKLNYIMMNLVPLALRMLTPEQRYARRDAIRYPQVWKELGKVDEIVDVHAMTKPVICIRQ